MVLHPAQNKIASDLHRFRVLRCGRRFGKTSLLAEEIKGIAISRPSRTAYIANNYQQARDIAWDLLKKELRPAIIDTNEQRLEIKTRTVKDGESLIVLRGWESVENLRGQAFDFLAVDETAHMRHFWLNWQEVLRPTLTDKKGTALFASTPKGFNHFYDLCNLELTDKDFKSFHFTTYDNPHVSKEEVDTARATLPYERFAQEYLAEFTKTAGLVYKEFDRERHLHENLPHGYQEMQRIGAVDWGFRNPAAVLEIYYDPHQEKFWIENEWYKTERTEAQIAEYVAGSRFSAVYPDPENQSGIEELRKRGVNVREVAKGRGSVKAGIDRVRELLITNKISVNKRCVNLIAEFESYSYEDDRIETNEKEEPVKSKDHACFAAGTTVNGKNIEEVGYPTGVQDVYEYQVAGERIQATKNHPVLTHRGFIDIDNLRNDDIVWKKKQLFMTVLSGIGIRTVLYGLTGVTFSALGRLIGAKERDCIGMFGEKRMEKSPLVTMFIILTAIPQITSLIIWSLYSAVNTLVAIGRQKRGSWLKKISEQLSMPPPNGLRPRWAGSFDPKWDTPTNISCSIAQSLREIVIYAGSPTKLRETEETGFATPTAVRRRYVGRAPVYNLKTRSGMYLANGILVSNCDALRYAIMTIVKNEIEEVKVFYE